MSRSPFSACATMAFRMPSTTARSLLRSSLIRQSPIASTTRSFTSSSLRLAQETPIAPTVGAVPVVKKPVGAFRGGLTGFLLGAVLAGGSMYYYVLDEYRVSNELLTEDIFNLRNTVSRIEGYIGSLEGKIAEADRKK